MIAEQTKTATQSIFEKHGVVLAYLFGSTARGTARNGSDVDVAVVFGEPVSDVGKRARRESMLGSDLESVFKREVDVINLDEVTSPLLRHRALRRGEAIYCIDHQRRQALELRALHDFEDTQYLREIVNRAMEKRIKSGTFGKPL